MHDALPQPRPKRRRATWLDEIALATVFMTRLPVRLRLDPEVDLHARSMGWFPLVGAAVGLLAGGVYALALGLNLPAMAAALLALAASAWVTGALHEDGLADVADGFGGGRSRERKLEIMRDSRVGSYGVLAVVFSVGLRASALAALAEPVVVVGALAAAGACSRAVLPALAWTLMPARRDGLAANHGCPPSKRVALALAIAAVVALLAVGKAVLAVAVAGALAAAVVGFLALRQIRGYTGDVLGAAQQAAETAILLTLVATQ
ncbi:adenosylcobinamide-GDP ribazoletransferase [Azospirillum sp.]|uniref:adenosylcobinamide-GDP ribazoletransferase n=1 Tax=Azospirillum sp. TaxID=34012 RepID=UPI002D37494C|nr:adenosylcobinamide-GDP ribazoletransferase [Azospirillum sp.]HYD69111.1 adenosylcobinamide-GDP ribazoletransferase [Azospirillum sp.]